MQLFRMVIVGEPVPVRIATLLLKLPQINGTAIDTRRRSGLKASYGKSNVLKSLSYFCRWRLAGSTSRDLGLQSLMNAPPEESSRRENYRPSSIDVTTHCLDTIYSSACHYQPGDSFLSEFDVWLSLQ
jgi:hypothetical protein